MTAVAAVLARCFLAQGFLAQGFLAQGFLAQGSLRRALAAFLCLACLFAGSAFAHDFDRAAELKRYRAWLTVFTQDMDRLAAARGPLNDAQLDAMFDKSVVPGSRAAGFIRQAFTRQSGDGDYRPQYGPRSVFLGVLASGIPAGQGGTYPESDAAFKGTDLIVWYLHVDVGDMTNTYLLSSGHFTPYRLPPAGTFERKAYPFLLMESRDGTLRLGGVSAELWGLVAWLHNAAN
ncbi:hypothetical protein [Achromobacter sp. UBA4530]|uniref:hypothetical protein n=1 Tax=Achromobacter sp. UBA4530 TaxID=1945912 RepID=UPI0025796C49|nr:hypothetical protein [Achromobacter sp. UBA4530]